MAVAVAGALLLAAGCGKDSTGVSTVVTGTWNGSAMQDGVTFSFSIQLTEVSGGQLRGTGTGSGALSGGRSSMLDVVGTRSGSNVSMTLSATGFTPMVYTGRLVDENEMEGKLDGSGFNQMSLTLRR
jgi:hypothetical protein